MWAGLQARCFCFRFAAIRPESVGPEGPPTGAQFPPPPA
ncbi:DUF6053 domain-containing protein [Lysobacter enzymogenes]